MNSVAYKYSFLRAVSCEVYQVLAFSGAISAYYKIYAHYSVPI